MLSKIKSYAVAGLAVLVGILAALWQFSVARHKSALLKGEKAARNTERKAVEIMIDGMEAENEIKKDNSTNRGKFLD